jgi:hypothetical protein
VGSGKRQTSNPEDMHQMRIMRWCDSITQEIPAEFSAGISVVPNWYCCNAELKSDVRRFVKPSRALKSKEKR